MYRHGDVGLTALITLPVNAKQIYAGTEYVVAEGEVTGHAHRIRANDLTVWELGGVRFLVVGDDATITHEEHGGRPVAPGTYKINIEHEFDPFARRMQEVKD